MHLFKYLPLLMLLCTVPALAQAVISDVPAVEQSWEVGIKLFFPVLWTAVSPYLTGFVTKGMLRVMSSVPNSLQVVVSSVIGMVMGGLAGAVPDFPVTVESGMAMGAAGGASGQVLANTHPDKLQPPENISGPGTAPETHKTTS